MAGYDVNVGKALLPGLLSGQDGLAKLIEAVLNQILEAQVVESLGADKHERSEERQGYRNGYRPRTLYTRVGPITLQVPQTRDGSFSTDIFRRYQRSEQAFVLALMEMVVQGVSTRKVNAITEELCGASFSKSTVSALCAGLDARVRAFNERRLDGNYPFLLVDALFFKSRDDDRVAGRAALIVSGITEDGKRQILGIRIGDTGSFSTWDETFRWLKSRGLAHVPIRWNRLIDKNMRQINSLSMILSQKWFHSCGSCSRRRDVRDLRQSWRIDPGNHQALSGGKLATVPGAPDAEPVVLQSGQAQG